MGLLRRMPHSGTSPNTPPAGAAPAPPAAEPVAAADLSRAPVGPDQPTPPDVKDAVRRSIIAELEADLLSSPGVNLHARIKDVFDRVIDARRLTLTETHRKQLFDTILADLVGFGPAELLIKDPTIEEILVLGPGRVYAKQRGQLVLTDVQFDDEAHLQLFIDRVAKRFRGRVDEANPLWQGRLPDDSAIHVAIPPVSPNGTVVAIQKHTRVGYSADELVQLQSLTSEIVELLRACVLARLNILVTGAPGAGKTTLLNLLRSFIPPDEIDLVVQVGGLTGEMTKPGPVVLVERKAGIDGQSEITPAELVRYAVALGPERIILERCSGPEAREMLEAMTRGVGGWISTVEGGSPPEALRWLEHLALSASAPVAPGRIAEWIGESIDVVVHVDRTRDGRRKVTSICEVVGVDETGKVILAEVFAFDAQQIESDGTGGFKALSKPTRLVTALDRAGVQIPDSVLRSF